MVQVCSVVGCFARGAKGSSRSFHRFPKDNQAMLQKWLNCISRIKENGDDWEPTKNSRVCSDHFLPEDYKEFTLVKVLKPTAYPTKFPSLPKDKEPNVTPKRTSPRKHPAPSGNFQKHARITTRKRKSCCLLDDSKKKVNPSLRKNSHLKIMEESQAPQEGTDLASPQEPSVLKDSSKSVRRRLRKIARPRVLGDVQQRAHCISQKDSSSLENSNSRESILHGSRGDADHKSLKDSQQCANRVPPINPSHSEKSQESANFITKKSPSPAGEHPKTTVSQSTKFKLDHGYACPSMEHELQLVKDELADARKKLAAKQMEAKALSQKIKRRDDMIAVLLAQLKAKQMTDNSGKDPDVSKVDFSADTGTIMLIENSKCEVNEVKVFQGVD